MNSSIKTYYLSLQLKEMKRLYWCHSVGALGIALAMIFVPIFLLKSGFSFQSVLWFLLLQQAMGAVLQFPASWLFGYVSSHYLLVIGSLCYAIFFGLLGSLHQYHWPLALVALAWALNRSIYWAAFHYIFGLTRSSKSSGRQIASVISLATSAVYIAPALGGAIASLLGIGYTYAAGILLLLVAVFPMLSTEHPLPLTKLRLEKSQAWGMRRDIVANMCNGIILMSEVNMWPMLIFLFVSSYAGIGALSEAVAGSSIAVSLYVGHDQDNRGRSSRRYLRRGLVTMSLVNLGRAFVQNGLQIFGLNLLAGVGRSFYVTPFMNRYYCNSDGSNRLGYITIMEVAFGIGSATYVGGLLVLATIFSVKAVLTISLSLAAFFILGVRLIR